MAVVSVALLVLGWYLGLNHPEGGRTIGHAMAGGYVLALLVLLLRAFRRRSERKGWVLLGLAMVCLAMVSALLTEAGQHQLEIRSGQMIVVLFLAAVAGGAIFHGILAWPSYRPSCQAAGRTLLNGLGGVFTGTSLWLLFWMGATWRERFRGNSAHHVHLLLLGLMVGLAAGVSAYLYLECPRRARGPIGVILVGLTLLTILFGVLGILSNSPGHHAGFAMLPGIPLVVALAAVKKAPAELCMGAPLPGLAFPELLPLLPFLTLGPVVGLALWREGGTVLWPALSLLAISCILAIRQVLLLRELRSANLHLESRVQERTQSLTNLQDRLLRHERMNTLGTLGAGLVHDLNNTIGVVQGSLDLARMDPTPHSPALMRHLDRIQKATKQMSSLSGRIMAFARREIEEPHLVDLSEEIRKVEPLLRMLLPRTVGMTVVIEQEVPHVWASTGLIEQVLMNLVGNARDAMPQGGEVQVRLGVAGDKPRKVIITVSDTGHGIPPHLQEQLFTPFFTTKPSGRGTGLGLASTKALLEEVGGTILLDSREGQGATFALTFSVP